MKKRIIYKKGDKVGHLTFIKELTKGKHRRALFQCHCGNHFDAQVDNAVSGRTKACGCDKKTQTVDGKRRGFTEYYSWRCMMQRCYEEQNNQYQNYGGRGISVCNEWHSFKQFIKDMGRKPKAKMSIDRIDVNGNYEPGNCRWATQQEQLRNTRFNRFITYNGVTKCIAEWADELNINRSTLFNRIVRHCWTAERALTLKPKIGRNQYAAG